MKIVHKLILITALPLVALLGLALFSQQQFRRLKASTDFMSDNIGFIREVGVWNGELS